MWAVKTIIQRSVGIIILKNDILREEPTPQSITYRNEQNCMHEQIGAKLYDRINSRENRSISDIESMKICRYDEMND